MINDLIKSVLSFSIFFCFLLWVFIVDPICLLAPKTPVQHSWHLLGHLLLAVEEAELRFEGQERVSIFIHSLIQHQLAGLLWQQEFLLLSVKIVFASRWNPWQVFGIIMLQWQGKFPGVGHYFFGVAVTRVFLEVFHLMGGLDVKDVIV